MKQIHKPKWTVSVVLQSLAISAVCQTVNDLKLKDFHPVSIYKIPETKIENHMIIQKQIWKWMNG
jgi:hypothetical protein